MGGVQSSLQHLQQPASLSLSAAAILSAPMAQDLHVLRDVQQLSHTHR